MKLANSLPANAMNVINTNIRAQFAQAALSMIERRQSVAMERLSTGKRINSARDDAAGLAIAARMSELIRGTHQAIQNANNGIGMIQTAESAAGQIGDRLQRMRELAVQASNGTYSDGQRHAMDLEYQQLKQDIVAVSRNTRWNGMSLMDAKAGTSVVPKALYKTVSAGQWVQQYGGQTELKGLVYDPRTSPTTVSQTDLQVSSPVNFTHKGKIVLDFTGSGTAQFIALDGSVTTLSIDNANSDSTQGVVKLDAQAGLMSQALELRTSSATDLTSQRMEITIDSSADLGVIGDKDLSLNGVDIAVQPDEVLDTASPTGNAAASAITKAAQINRFSHQTGVTAVVNRNLMSGRAISEVGAMTGTLNINGYLTAQITTSSTDSEITRQQVLTAINALTQRTGIQAIDSRLTDGGITLVAEDGRNIDVEMFSSNNARFAAMIGVNSGVQVGTYSLAVQTGKGLKVAAALEGDLQHSGLLAGNYTAANVATVVTSERAMVSRMQDIQYLHDGDLLINGVAIPAAKATDDTVSNTSTDTSSRAASGIALAAAVNTLTEKTGVTALVQPVLINGTGMTTDFHDPAALFLNGQRIDVDMNLWATAADRKHGLLGLINAKSSLTGVDAVDNGTGGISLKARDGRNVSVWFMKDSGVLANTSSPDLTAAEFGLGYVPAGLSTVEPLPGISYGLDGESRLGATFYAGVVLQAARDISIQAGPAALVQGSIGAISYANGSQALADGDYAMVNSQGDHAMVRVISSPPTVPTLTPMVLNPGHSFAVNDVLTSQGSPSFSVQVDSIVAPYSRFAALGFTETDASVISSIQAEHYQPPAVSRLDFQVGNRAGEKISIDMPDFGAQGSITHLVTWDVNQTYLPPEQAPGTLPGADVISLRNGLGRTTLGQDIDAVTTTIPVRSTEGFPSTGTVYIDNELITYTGITGNNLTGVTRGAMNTPTQTHRGDAIVRRSSEALLSNLFDVDPLAPPLQVGLTVEPPPSHVLDQQSASRVLLSLDAALYQINQARSNMGAVMNRLEYSVSNLYDTYTNMSASRSKIEDADYAAESSDMARAQIIQQAATAILAQANTNQQTVLKLLQ